MSEDEIGRAMERQWRDYGNAPVNHRRTETSLAQAEVDYKNGFQAGYEAWKAVTQGEWTPKLVRRGEYDPADVVLPDGRTIIRSVPYYAAEVLSMEHNRAEAAEAQVAALTAQVAALEAVRRSLEIELGLADLFAISHELRGRLLSLISEVATDPARETPPDA